MREKNLDNLAELVKDIMGYDVRLTRGRPQKYVRPKAAMAVVAANWYGIDLTTVGRYLNWTDHTTVVHHRKNHKYRYRSDDEYAEIYDELMRRVTKNDTNTEGFEDILSLVKKLQ